MLNIWLLLIVNKVSKNTILSNNNIVIPPANTGNANNNKIAVIKTDQINNGILCKFIIDILRFKIVTIKFIAPSIDEIPARCKLNIAKSIDGPEWANALDNGGYKVQPVPAPFSTNIELNNKINEGTKSQKETLLSLG